MIDGDGSKTGNPAVPFLFKIITISVRLAINAFVLEASSGGNAFRDSTKNAVMIAENKPTCTRFYHHELKKRISRETYKNECGV